MANRLKLCALGAASASILSGCASPFDTSEQSRSTHTLSTLPQDSSIPRSVYRQRELQNQNQNQNQSQSQDQDQDQNSSQERESSDMVGLSFELDSTPESYLRYALFHSPEVERAYQQWRASSERLPQVSSLPDPRLNVGFFLNEVETRVGPQQAKVGIKQTFPWMGKLRDRKDAAAKGALAAWSLYQDAQNTTVERVMTSLFELAYLDSTIGITEDNLSLLKTFEEIVRARYRVGAQSHPQLIKVQVELGQLEDRVIQLRALRPSYVAAINAALNRSPDAPVRSDLALAHLLTAQSSKELVAMAHEWNPVLESFDQRIEQQRMLSEVARKNGYPDITVGIDYVVTDQASNTSLPESGDDPLLLSFGLNLPIWREKYDAGVRETIAKRLSISRAKDAKSNAIDAQIYQAWFAHTDANRRVKLYEQSLIPKAQESLSASLTSFRTGDSSFLDLLDTQRTLLEFSIAAQRARADQGKSLAKLNRIVGKAIPTVDADESTPAPTQSKSNTNEVQP